MSIKRWTIALLTLCAGACGKDAPTDAGVFSTRASPAAEADAVAEGATADGAPIGAELRAKLKTLAVASECLRRGDAPADEVSAAMMTLYKTHGVELAVYAREMGRLGGDAVFQAEIQAELERCPTPAVAIGVAADVVDAPPAEDVGAAAPEDVGPTGDPADVGADDDVVDLAAGLGDGSSLAGVGDKADAVSEVAADASETPTVKDDLSGTWTGAVRGSISATLRVVVRGRSVSSATMTWSGQSVHLQGTIAKNGQMSLGGRINAADFVRLRGRINKAGRALSGTWDGVVARKRAQGSIQLSR